MFGTTPHSTLTLRLDASALRAWQLRLIQRLEAQTNRNIFVAWGKSTWSLPPAATLLFDLECLVQRLPNYGPMTPLTKRELAAYDKPAPADGLVLDLCGDLIEQAGTVWQLLFNGGCGEGAALNSLINGVPPYLELRDLSTRQTIASAHPGTENPHVIVKALSDIMIRAATLILATVAGDRVRTPLPVLKPKASTQLELSVFAAKSLTRTLAVRLYHLCYYTPHWKVGWHFFDGPSVLETGQHPADGWKRIPDNGRHFYADPFPLFRNGKYHVFVEDFDQRRGYGVVSAFEFDENGPLGEAKVVLDAGSHLSYPFVFEAEGEVWMIPESTSAKRVELFRAAKYPDIWVKEAVLLDNDEISDATIFEHQGRWWMMASLRDEGGSYSDSLAIWSAPNFRGPWTPLNNNPILIDIARSRPGGRVMNVNGALIRPVQDCTSCYGHSLSFARITKLDDEGFEQTIGAQLRAGPLWPGRRLHTYNASGRLQMIDGSSAGRKFF